MEKARNLTTDSAWPTSARSWAGSALPWRWSAVASWAKDARGRSKTTAFAEDRWPAFLKATAEQPREAEFTLCRLDSGGSTHSWPFLKVSARPSDDFPNWWFLEAHFPEEWMTTPDFDEEVCQFLRDVAALGDPSHACHPAGRSSPTSPSTASRAGRRTRCAGHTPRSGRRRAGAGRHGDRRARRCG